MASACRRGLRGSGAKCDGEPPREPHLFNRRERETPPRSRRTLPVKAAGGKEHHLDRHRIEHHAHDLGRKALELGGPDVKVDRAAREAEHARVRHAGRHPDRALRRYRPVAALELQADEPANGQCKLSGRMRMERQSRRICAHVDMFVDDGGDGKDGRIVGIEVDGPFCDEGLVEGGACGHASKGLRAVRLTSGYASGPMMGRRESPPGKRAASARSGQARLAGRP